MMTNEPTKTSTSEQQPNTSEHPVGKDECFVCHGFGHWARECTSLPATFLKENAPKCYNCYGTGHYARFCPNSILIYGYIFQHIVVCSAVCQAGNCVL